MSVLERIIAEGNKVAWLEGMSTAEYKRRVSAKPTNTIRCADGFTVSVIAGWGTYCAPRPGSFNSVPETCEGPFWDVEVGFPSERPEPWAEWSEYAESAEDPTQSVYGYVPVQLVRDLIALHGGEAS